MQSETTFKTVIDSLESGVAILDQDLCLLYVNEWLIQRIAVPSEQLLGRSLQEIFPELQNSYLIECCFDTLRETLPKQLSNSFNPSPLPLYKPNQVGDESARLQQAITLRPLVMDGQPACEVMVYDVTRAVIKENWLKRVAATFRQQAQQQEFSLAQFSQIIENTADAIVVFASNGDIEFANASARHLFGWQDGQALTATLTDVLDARHDTRHQELLQRLNQSLQEADGPTQIPTAGGHLYNSEGELIPVEFRFSISQERDRKQLVTIIRDCSHLVETEQNFLASENRFRTLAKIAPVGIFRTCKRGILRYANETWFSLTGLHPEEINRIHWMECLADGEREKLRPKWLSLRNNRVDLREEVRISNRQMKPKFSTWVLCNIMAEHDVHDQVSGFVGTLTDISQQRSNQEEIERLAYHDMLTGLPNRRYFRDKLEQQIRVNRREQKSFALFALDLNGFKQINDTLGHDAGDQVLKTIAQRLQNLLRESASISRIGGDEFCVMIPGFNDVQSLEVIAQRIITMVREPIQLNNQESTLSTSIGIALFPSDAENANDLIKHADLALYAAKGNHQSPFVFFDKGMNQKAESNRALVNDLENAITEEQFDLYLMPTAPHTDSRTEVSIRALLRWQHDNWGEVFQADFSRALERSRLIKPFTLLYLEHICGLFNDLRQRLPQLERIQLTAHFQAFQLLHGSFIDDIQRMFQRHQLPAQFMEIELSETSTNDFFGSLLPTILKLQRLGFSLALSDFTGSHLSLQKISKLPLSTLRLCPELLDHASGHRESRLQLATICDLANRLEISLQATTNKHTDHTQLLTELGCQRFSLSHTRTAIPAGTYINQRSDSPTTPESYCG